MTAKPFYCSGSPHGEFSIEKWNDEFELISAMGIEDEAVLIGDYDCKEQCERCLNIVIEHHRTKQKNDKDYV